MVIVRHLQCSLACGAFLVLMYHTLIQYQRKELVDSHRLKLTEKSRLTIGLSIAASV